MTERRKESFFQIAIGGSSREDNLNQEEFYRRLTLAGFLIDDVGQVSFGNVPPLIVDGSGITGLDADNLATGTVPLARLSNIANAQISASAAIAQSKLALSITNAEVNASAAIAYSKLAIADGDLTWAKVSKSGSSLADLATKSAGALDSGNLPYAQMPTGSGTWTASPTISGATVFSSTVQVDGDLTIGGGDLIASANLVIRRNTSDGSDSGLVQMTGAGAWADNGSRGAGFSASGNEHSDPGRAWINLGNIANAKLSVLGDGGTEWLALLGNTGATTFTSSAAVPVTISQSSTGDAGIKLSLSDQDWVMGVDNDGSNEFVISASGTLGTNNRLTMSVNFPGIQMRSTAIEPTTNNSMSFGVNGARWTEIFATNGTINTSDELLKDIVGEVPGLAFINALRPFAGRWKDKPEQLHYWLGARATGALVPLDSAMVLRDDENGWGMNQGELGAPIIKAIQELTARIERAGL